MGELISRRRVLQVGVSAAAVGLAGCTSVLGGKGDNDMRCSMRNIVDESAPPLVRTRVTLERANETVLLLLQLRKSKIEETEASVINVYNPQHEDNDPEYTLPIIGNGVQSQVPESEKYIFKRTSLGRLPIAGQFRVEVEDSDGEVIAWQKFDYECAEVQINYNW